MIRRFVNTTTRIFYRVIHLPVRVLALAALGGVLLGAIFFLGLTHFSTSRPEYCLTCHYWQGQVSFLKKSLVHPQINCSECHARHAEWIPRDYQAEPERTDSNCVRCHADVPKKDIQSFKHNVMKINIPHKFHIEQTGGQCSLCHDNIMHDKMAPETNRPRMDSCFACHERTKTSCVKCHPKGSIDLPHQVHVIRSECNLCHKGFEDYQGKIYDISFPHRKHLNGDMSCEACHSNKEKHGQILPKREECLKCHHEKVKADCAVCHRAGIPIPKGDPQKERSSIPTLR